MNIADFRLPIANWILGQKANRYQKISFGNRGMLS
jgi:hypothetical protein